MSTTNALKPDEALDLMWHHARRAHQLAEMGYETAVARATMHATVAMAFRDACLAQALHDAMQKGEPWKPTAETDPTKR